MKKVLFATTALVAFAGAAAADVAISGFAEMGVADNGNGDLQYFQDIDVTFGMSGETDGGLAFGASVDLDENGAFAPETHGGATVFISGSFGTLTMGDTDGAYDWAMTETAVGDAMADDHTEHAGYSGNGMELGDGQVLRYDYSFGDVAFAVSMTQGDDGADVVDDTTEVGVRYSVDMGGASVALGLSYMDAGTQTTVLDATTTPVTSITGDTGSVGVSVAVTSGALTGIVNYSDGELSGVDLTHTGVGIGYSAGALTVGLNYGEIEGPGGDADGYGLAVNYDLGGGAVVQFGYGDGEDTDTMSFGLAMSF